MVWKDETVSVGFLEVLIAPIPSSLALFTDLPVVASAIPCRFDAVVVLSVKICSPCSEQIWDTNMFMPYGSRAGTD